MKSGEDNLYLPHVLVDRTLCCLWLPPLFFNHF